MPTHAAQGKARNAEEGDAEGADKEGADKEGADKEGADKEGADKAEADEDGNGLGMALAGRSRLTVGNWGVETWRLGQPAPLLTYPR